MTATGSEGMEAIVCNAFDGPDALVMGSLPEPVCGDDEVLVSVRAAAVSFMDRLMVSGGYQMKPAFPFAPGTDAAGVVRKVGAGVTTLREGDRVVGSTWVGAYAETVAFKGSRCAVLPDNVSFEAAATLPYAYLTARHAFADRAALRPGEICLVTGATGGAGLAALDTARAMGARTIAVVGRREKAAIAKEYGAEAVVVLADEDLRTAVKALTDGRGVDVCFETLGGDPFLACARLMAPGGRLMPIGFATGTIPALPMNLPLVKAYSVVGVFMGAWADAEPLASQQALRAIVADVAAGTLKPRVDTVLPLKDAAAAMARLGARDVVGRIVLSLPPR
ncbi:NADPH:quinone oxidoreductase family protein [Acuticoccus sp. MNP-M23]|uniref:NADPH:quinone oxidoreductase family protein n=1 Tax=Acuticoccus sp. MNP-M23 TaxID=3072793 RepID=UPI002815AB51|nr:NADPH:quinone oxidoreductase family protein [Acuticoccus sp. MNP-M23]WMS42047.1 NADPH:quinone oxidoreductase family protein [Acuticoccus sp. MNP-M23]